MLMDMCLPKFDIYQGTVAPNFLRAKQTLDVLIFFKKRFCLMPSLKFTLSDVTTFRPDNLSGLKKIIFRSVQGRGDFSENILLKGLLPVYF